ncbi:MAG: HlyC/CorC family transporter, partial [Eubacteriales bacterium]
FFSAAETAFSSLNKIRLKMMADEGNRRAALAYSMTENFDKLLSTVLIGNNIVNIASTSLATILFMEIFGSKNGPTISTVVMTVLVLIFGEVTPKSIAKEMPEKFAIFAAPLLKFLMVVFTPFVAFFAAWKNMLKKMFHFKSDDTITGDELINIVDEAESGGGIDEEESDLIRSAIQFSDFSLEDILTPRVDIVAVDENDSPEEIERVFGESGFSRLPVYKESLDDIIGFIHIRDFTKYVLGSGYPVNKIIRNVIFVTDQTAISDLLKQMQMKKSHMAVVLDEYGGTIGIATMEDILEELVGEIWDESDEIIEEFKTLDDGRVMVLCGASLAKMFDYLGLEPPEDTDAVSVGGWVTEHLEKIAEEGDSFEYENLEITVTKTENHRVLEIAVTIREPALAEN